MTSPLLACVTCMGQEGQLTTHATNGAVFVMFGALGLVFCGLIAVCITFARRMRRYERQLAHHS